jgi:hypothetical protein
MKSSFTDCIASLTMMKALTDAGHVDLLLPAHGPVKEGPDAIGNHLDAQIRRMETIRDEVLAAHATSGETSVPRLTRRLIQTSPLFRALRQADFPRCVAFVHNAVALCLIEEGILIRR